MASSMDHGRVGPITTTMNDVRDVKTRKSAGKQNAEWLIHEKKVKLNSEKSSGRLNHILSSPGLGLKQNQQGVSLPFSFV